MSPYAALFKHDQFIVCKGKIPTDPASLHPTNPHDPKNWLTFDAAQQWVGEFGEGYGIGFALTRSDPFNTIDIDKALLPDGTWNAQANELCQTFSGSLVEVSQSGRGLHIFFTGDMPAHGCKNQALGLELYSSDRYILLGNMETAVGDSGFKPSEELKAQLVAKYFPPTAKGVDAEWNDGPAEGWGGPENDDELIKIMLASRSAASIFGNKASVAALWNADSSVLSNAFPDGGGREFDHSSADAALCAHLSFWTGRDSQRMDRIFRESSLFRDKWENREDYAHRTIAHANGHCKQVYSQRKPDPELPEIIERSGFQFMDLTQQQEYFKGCVYVTHDHAIFAPNGVFYKPEQFKAAYGGYSFAIDGTNSTDTKNAWEAFTLSQGLTFPRADMTCFKPDLKPSLIIQEEGWSLVNTYVPIHTERRAGDAGPFLALLAKLYPVPHDREIILAYMAAFVQHPGIKFHWSPLTQGIQGNGKSFLAECIAYCVGWRYTHKPPADDVGNTFNAWLRNKLYIWVDEVYTRNKPETMESLKWLISDEKGPITPKGVDQFTGDNRANFWCNTNHKDALKLAGGDRRWSIFYTPQQSIADLERDGMLGDYFPHLFDWLRKEGGHAFINEYLHNYNIPDELNPATKCHRGPITSSTDESLQLSLGGLEQEILESIEQGKQGFAGGWVSSMAFDRLIKDRNDSKRISMNRRKEILYSLGYILHPGLKNGRVNAPILLEGGRTKLYIKPDHPQIGNPDVAETYLLAQGVDPLVS